jgi:ATP-dependent helicase HrpB
VLSGGGAAAASRESVVHDAAFAVVVDAEERREPGARGGVVRARSVAAIEPEWLLEHFPERIEERVRVAFDAARERVVARGEVRYGELVLDDTPLRQVPEEATALLREAALAAGPEAFVADAEALRTLLARTRFAHALDARVPALGDADARAALAALCEGRTSFAALRAAGLEEALRAGLGGEGAALLDRLAPRDVALPRRARVPVRYEADRPPWIASRLQDFLGAREGPRIGGGRTPLVLHLLAPNQRAVQVTTDLAGFWREHYPSLRKTLMRRYPRHAWPEDPLRPPPPDTPRRRA